MSKVLTLPRLGETMESGRIVAWLVEPGKPFKRGDSLLEVETDKLLVEVPALEDGEVAEIVAEAGSTVRVGDPLARLVGGESEAQTQQNDAKAATPTENRQAQQQSAAAPPPRTPSPRTITPSAPERVRATPLARRLAREAGIDISTIIGTGRRGRIQRADIIAHQAPLGFPLQSSASREIAYSLAGPGGGPPILLLHGFAGDRTVWSGLMSGLVRAGHRVLSPDLPAHGDTTMDAGSPDDLVSGLRELVSQTLGDQAHIVAHSLGAVPGIALAEAGVARSLTLIAPAGLGLAIDSVFVRGLAHAKSAGEVAHLLDRMTDAPLDLSSAALEEITATLRQGRLIPLADALLGVSGQTICLRRSLAKLAETVPTAVVACHRDRILDWSDMVTVSPHIAAYHLPRAGHMAMWDEPNAVLSILHRVIAL